MTVPDWKSLIKEHRRENTHTLILTKKSKLSCLKFRIVENESEGRCLSI